MPIEPQQAPSRSQRAQPAVHLPAHVLFIVYYLLLLKNKKKGEGGVWQMGLASPQWFRGRRARSREVASVVLVRSELHDFASNEELLVCCC